MAEEFDLFGLPVLAKVERRGRPKHVPSGENRNRVNMLLALGWSNERISGALGITPPTLRRYYFSELKYREVARDRLDMRRAELLWKQVEQGNVGAMREFSRFVDKNDMMKAESDMGAPDAPAEKVGKKAIDKQRAMDADADLMAELEREATANAHH